MGLAKAVPRDRTVTGRLDLARADGLRVITSAATLVGVVLPRINRPVLEWTLSRLVVEPVTGPIARHAATALAAPGPFTVLAPGSEDLTTPCGGRATVIKI
ncbi:DNA-binding protein [Streptomyces sp. MUM 203J]|uniref:DNA-binding protein n=1 Tax=Streptomyces sp. MUM 203J TaxID=2791990 RepID=UPI001F041EE3|nr:DNA-binding protein [Streptomyces sp. MUM 203J]MCH0541007.1 DNA-binding protein [Streptomyces sp. MUM 203J]